MIHKWVSSDKKKKNVQGIYSHKYACLETVTDLGVLQRSLIAGRPVVHPLARLGVDVPQKQLLHQVIQVVMRILLLHPQQLQLVHGKVQLPGAVAAALLAPQLIADVGLPGALALHGPSAAAVEPLAELLGHGGRVTHHLGTVELIVGLGAAADDPGGLAKAQTAPNHQRVGGRGAVVVLVVELMGLEGVVGVEPVGAR